MSAAPHTPAGRPTRDELRERLANAFPGASLEIVDESHLHAGHAGAAGGAGHYRVVIAHASMADRARIARHRLVYDALRDWIPTRIHALTIDARAPGERVDRPEASRADRVQPTGPDPGASEPRTIQEPKE